jgi:integron integrase
MTSPTLRDHARLRDAEGDGTRTAAPEADGATPGRLLPRLRAALRVRHYSARTEEAYVGWVRRYVRFHGLRHPSVLGERDVAAFLTHLAIAGRVAPATQNQALAALQFLYRDVLARPLALPAAAAVRAKRAPRVPVVLTREEAWAVIGALRGPSALVALLLYGAGLRLLECLRLRVKDVDLARAELTVRAGKGGKDRRTVLPEAARAPLAEQLARVRRLHASDLARGGGEVPLPGALARKLPGASRSWGWQWVFPAARRYLDPATGRPVRAPLHETAVQRAVAAAVRGLGLTSARPVTRSATRSPRTCSRTATTSARCRSCSGTATCARR